MLNPNMRSGGIDDSAPVELERPHTDRRAVTAGFEIVAHRSRESFMLATGGAPEPARKEQLSASDCRAGMLSAWRQKYADPILATDAEIRACTRLLATERAQ